jgi:2'-5' RNA ligase
MYNKKKCENLASVLQLAVDDIWFTPHFTLYQIWSRTHQDNVVEQIILRNPPSALIVRHCEAK